MLAAHMQYDKEEVRESLPVADYVLALGIKLRRVGNGLRGACPLCGGSERATKFVINDQLWHCKACNQGGDVFQLCMQVERCTFREAVAKLAEIAGVAPRERSRRQRQPSGEYARVNKRDTQRKARRSSVHKQREIAALRASQRWLSLKRTSEPGEAYLRERGVLAARDEVRFSRHSVYLPLREVNGRVINLVGRRFDGGEPKIRGMSGASTDGMFGDARKIDETVHFIMIVEGVFDWLSARVMFPERLICGAHGAGRLVHVAKMIAPLAIERKRLLCFVPHHDLAGEREMDHAIATALELGVPIEQMTLFDIGEGYNDLNDYLRQRGS